MRNGCAHVVFALALMASHVVSGQQNGTTGELKVDPLLIAQAAEVWTLIGSPDNPLWPGWQGKDTPILIYLPGQQDVLINHPSPPQGFTPYTGPVSFPVGSISLRNGETLISYDGQNTSMEIEGHQTLVVADTLSNLKNNLISIIEDPAPAAEKIERLEYRSLCSGPYDTLGLIAHEAFHVFQQSAAGGKSGNEMALAHYPTLDVVNNVGFALEGKLLAEALGTNDRDACRRLAVQWLAVRQWRRARLSTDDIAYEDGTEFSEGLAKYIEYRLLQVLEGRTPGAQMQWVRGFRGYGDLSSERNRLIEMMARHMSGQVNVNNDPYGASPLRMRLYFSGMAIGALLDKLESSWHAAVLEPDATLTTLARSALAPQPGELEAVVDSLPTRPDYEALRAEKTRLHDAGREWIQAQLDAIEHGPQTTLVIDYSRLPDPKVAMSFTPFGIVAVDSDRTIFRLIPLAVRVGADAHFQQTRTSPVLQDRKAKQFVCQLSARMSREQFLQAIQATELPQGPSPCAELALPGVKLNLGCAEVMWREDRITYTLCPKP